MEARGETSQTPRLKTHEASAGGAGQPGTPPLGHAGLEGHAVWADCTQSCRGTGHVLSACSQGAGSLSVARDTRVSTSSRERGLGDARPWTGMAASRLCWVLEKGHYCFSVCFSFGPRQATYLGFLPIVGEVVQAEGAVGWVVGHLQGSGVPGGPVLGEERGWVRRRQVRRLCTGHQPPWGRSSHAPAGPSGSDRAGLGGDGSLESVMASWQHVLPLWEWSCWRAQALQRTTWGTWPVSPSRPTPRRDPSRESPNRLRPHPCKDRGLAGPPSGATGWACPVTGLWVVCGPVCAELRADTDPGTCPAAVVWETWDLPERHAGPSSPMLAPIKWPWLLVTWRTFVSDQVKEQGTTVPRVFQTAGAPWRAGDGRPRRPVATARGHTSPWLQTPPRAWPRAAVQACPHEPPAAVLTRKVQSTRGAVSLLGRNLTIWTERCALCGSAVAAAPLRSPCRPPAHLRARPRCRGGVGWVLVAACVALRWCR